MSRIAIFAVAMALGCAGAMGDVYRLDWLGTFESFAYDQDAAENIAYAPSIRSAVVASADQGLLDVISIADVTNPVKIGTINVLGSLLTVEGYAGESVQGVIVAGSVIVAAVVAEVEQDPGVLAFFDLVSFGFLGSVSTGAQPEGLSVSPDGSLIACVNEGTPEEYEVGFFDPAGSVTVVEVVADNSLNFEIISSETIDFSQFEADGPSALLAAGVRLFGPSANNLTADLEPEASAFSEDGTKLYVNLQDNSAVARLDIATLTWDFLVGYGFPELTLDPSDRDDAINIASSFFGITVKGMPQPDSIAVKEIGGVTYLFTSNEGDSRDFDEERIKDLTLLCPVNTTIQEDEVLGRLQVTTEFPATLVDGVSDCDELFSYGARSVSIFSVNDTGITLVADTGDLFENITAAVLPDFFNANDDTAEFDSRSDAKGPEPEIILLAEVDGAILLFCGLERIGGIVVIDVTDPTNPTFQDYINRRNFGVTDPDLGELGELGLFIGLDVGPEGLIFIPADISPTCAPILGVSNALSGSTTFYQVGFGPERPASEAAGSCVFTSEAEFSTNCPVYANPQFPMSACTASPGSCVGNCGGNDADGGCYCDAVCETAGDCCPDFDQVCDPQDFCPPGTVPGDVNFDGALTVTDIILLNNLTLNGSGDIGAAPSCQQTIGDANSNGVINVTDIVIFVSQILGNQSPSP